MKTEAERFLAAIQKIENKFPGAVRSIQKGIPYRVPKLIPPLFSIGQRVKFSGRKNRIVVGTIRKITRTGRIQIVVPGESGWWSVVPEDVQAA